MCIIAAKAAGKKMPSAQCIENMFYGNSDGAGLMWAANGKVYIEKGFMEYEHFKSRLEELDRKWNFEKLSVVMHFRITTHGGTKPENCHPFPVTDSEGMLKKLRSTTDLGIAHNGIIDIKCRGGMSDTMTYIASQVAPLKRAVPKFYKDKDLLQMMENAINGSRIAILDKKGGITLIGDWVEEDGISYSNSSYKHTPFLRDFSWSRFESWENPDKWEIGYDKFTYRHEKLMWIDADAGHECFDQFGEEQMDAAISKDGVIYIYDDVVGAMRADYDAIAFDECGCELEYDPKGCIVDELIIDEM